MVHQLWWSGINTKKIIPNKETKSEKEIKKLHDDSDEKYDKFWNSIPVSTYLGELFMVYVLWSNNLFDDIFSLLRVTVL